MTEGFFLITIFLVLFILFFFALLRITTRFRKERDELKKRDESQVGFIVGTFHELVAKLKDKERELDALRKKAEERANVIESNNEHILQSVSSGVISLDSDLVITKVNVAAERILSLNAEQVIGKHYHEVFREPLKGILDGKTIIERGEIPYTTHSGKSIHIGLTLTPLLNETRETIGQLMVFTDLTELKALQSQAELRDRLSTLGEMTAGMAHELRNPMAVIAGYTKMLSKKVDPSTTHIVDSIAKEIAVMDRIITDFLSFAKPSDLNISIIDLEQLIKNCASNSTGGRKDIAVQFALQGIPPLHGDEILLRQAFTNLIQNAVEAMPRGGDLHFSFSAGTDHVEITVLDSGHGIPDKIRDKIFLPFYTTKDQGTGLGLAIVHKIVVSHRGSIITESSEMGTIFRIQLPLDRN